MRSQPRPGEETRGHTEPPDAEDAGSPPLWGGARRGTSPRRAAGFPGAFLGNSGRDLELGHSRPSWGIPGCWPLSLSWRIILPLRALQKLKLAQTEAPSPWLQARVQGTRAGAGISRAGRKALGVSARRAGVSGSPSGAAVCSGCGEEGRPGEAWQGEEHTVLSALTRALLCSPGQGWWPPGLWAEGWSRHLPGGRVRGQRWEAAALLSPQETASRGVPL